MPARSSPPLTELAFDDTGGPAPVAVLLHGQPGSRRDWQAVVASLGTRVRAVVPDRPGYGTTPGPAVGVAANGRAVVTMLDRLGVQSATLVGHSWGGAVALSAALQEPSRVASLVLVASVGGSGSLDDLDRLLGTPVLGPVLAFGGLLALSAPRVRRRIAPGLPGSSVFDLRSFVVEQRALLDELPAITDRLPTVQVPSTVVVGRMDRVVRPAAQHALAAAIGATTVSVPDGGHLLPLEAPDVIADAVVRAAGHHGDP